MVAVRPVSGSDPSTLARASLEVSLLGPVRVVARGEPMNLTPIAAALPLLAYLLLHRHRRLTRRHVAFTLWPDEPEAEALGHLRRQVYLLSQTLPEATSGQPWILADRVGIQWNPEADTWLDVEAFESCCMEAGAKGWRGTPSPGMVEIQRARELYAGDLLSDCYDDWIPVERERLRRVWAVALRRAIAGQLEAGRIHDAAAESELLVEHDRLCEESHRLRIGLLYLAGDRAAALEAAEACRAELAEHLDVEPMETTRQLEADIRRGADPTALLEQLRRDLPPDIDLDACLQAHTPNNLRPILNRFIGRQREQVELLERISRHRLVTIVGAGGCGKSRLAHAVGIVLLRSHRQIGAQRADPDAASASVIGTDGLWWVDLAPVTDPGLVPQAIATAMGLTGAPGTSILELVTRTLGQRRVLLILDNVEQVLDGCAPTLEHLLRASARLRVLATSQERLGIAGETLMPLAGLSLPAASAHAGAEELLAYDAPRLFVERARRADPSFRPGARDAMVVAELCRGLGGLPLALELAASQVGQLPIARIREELLGFLPAGPCSEDLGHSQRVLGMIEWSHARLVDPERIVLRRLSTFQGGFTIEDAEAVATGMGIDVAYMPVLVESLATKSLLVKGSREVWRWYRMLLPIRHYARAELVRAGEAEAIGSRHFEHYLALAEAADGALRGPDQSAWLARLDVEEGNLRVALAWAADDDDRAEGELRLATALRWFWYIRGHLDEGRARLAQALVRAAEAPPVRRASALSALGTLAWRQGDFAAARESYEDSLRCSQQARDDRAAGLVLGNLGMLALTQGKLDLAQRRLEESIAALEACDDRRGLANGLGNLGLVHLRRGELSRARAQITRCLTLQRALGDRRAVALAHQNLGRIEHGLGRDRRARRAFEQALSGLRELGDRAGEADVLNDLGNHAAWQGAHAEARRHLQASLRCYQELGLASGISASLGHLGQLARLEGDPDQARMLLHRSLEIAEEIDHTSGIASVLTMLAELAADRDQPRQAARLAGAGQALLERQGLAIHGLERQDHERCLERLRAALGREAFEVEWAAGRALTTTQALRLARGEGAWV